MNQQILTSLLITVVTSGILLARYNHQQIYLQEEVQNNPCKVQYKERDQLLQVNCFEKQTTDDNLLEILEELKSQYSDVVEEQQNEITKVQLNFAGTKDITKTCPIFQTLGQFDDVHDFEIRMSGNNISKIECVEQGPTFALHLKFLFDNNALDDTGIKGVSELSKYQYLDSLDFWVGNSKFYEGENKITNTRFLTFLNSLERLTNLFLLLGNVKNLQVNFDEVRLSPILKHLNFFVQNSDISDLDFLRDISNSGARRLGILALNLSENPISDYESKKLSYLRGFNLYYANVDLSDTKWQYPCTAYTSLHSAQPRCNIDINLGDYQYDPKWQKLNCP